MRNNEFLVESHDSQPHPRPTVRREVVSFVFSPHDTSDDNGNFGKGFSSQRRNQSRKPLDCDKGA